MVEPDTVYDLASLTKVVATTTIAMLLFERGKLPLDESLATTFPDFVELAAKHPSRNRVGR